MLWTKIICWAYLIFIIMGRIVNHDKSDYNAMKVRIIDNIMIVILIVLLIIVKMLS